VESALLDDLKKGADDYRRKDLFEFRPLQRDAPRADAQTAKQSSSIA